MSYLKRRWRQYFLCGVVLLCFNLYFACLLQEGRLTYLWYLDFLLALFLAVFSGIDIYLFRQEENRKESLLLQEDMILEQMGDFENREIAEHDTAVLKEQLQKEFQENCELQDYVAKWCHEFKIPLAAGLLMVEKIPEAEHRQALREQLEKMNRQVRSMLSGCRLQSSLTDFQIRKTSLQECIKRAVKNNQFFLIKQGFELCVQVEEEYVYTDPEWLVYILDQLIDNAIKYAGEKNTEQRGHLHFWTESGERTGVVSLWIEDRGEGIRDSDIRRIFEKGFTGSNYHNGKYKSTGMGLYMVSKIIRRLGHEIFVESKYGEYTRFRITFTSNDYFLV